MFKVFNFLFDVEFIGFVIFTQVSPRLRMHRKCSVCQAFIIVSSQRGAPGGSTRCSRRTRFLFRIQSTYSTIGATSFFCMLFVNSSPNLMLCCKCCLPNICLFVVVRRRIYTNQFVCIYKYLPNFFEKQQLSKTVEQIQVFSITILLLDPFYFRAVQKSSFPPF